MNAQQLKFWKRLKAGENGENHENITKYTHNEKILMRWFSLVYVTESRKISYKSLVNIKREFHFSGQFLYETYLTPKNTQQLTLVVREERRVGLPIKWSLFTII